MTVRTPSLLLAFGRSVILAVAVTSLALLLLLSVRNSQIIDRIENRALQGRAEMIAQHLRRDTEGNWVLDLPADVAAAFSIVYGRAAYAVVDATGTMLLGAGTATPLAPPTQRVVPAPFELERGGRIFNGMSVPALVEGVPLTIQVAEDQDHPDVLLDDARSGFPIHVAWVVLLPVLIAFGAAEVAVLHRLTRPIRLLSRRVERLSPHRPEQRLPEQGLPREVLPLAHAVNGALARLQAAREAQRAFTAHAAHEFRTPLAVLRARLELLADPRTAQILGDDLAVFERLVAQMLAIAEVDDANALPDAALDLRHLIESVMRFVGTLAAPKRITLRAELPEVPVWVRAHEEALSQAVMNLLENAIGHAPEGSSVRISLSPTGALDVADSGPGVPEHEREAVFRRFWRSNRRIASDRRGAGLGLAIVQRAAEIHGGRVEIGTAPEGGALFRLRLPILAGAPG